ncbi:MAG: VOC family protein [Ilumatobacteraceae bacterium]
MATTPPDERADRTAEWESLRRTYLLDARAASRLVGPRRPSRGAHLERRGADDPLLPRGLGVPLTELFENRDYPGSTHFFFDIGHQNALAFFDLPGLDVGAYAEVLGGLHHLAISVEPENWARIKARLDALGIEYAHIDGTSIYFRGPDGERLELIVDPLGELYGSPVM